MDETTAGKTQKNYFNFNYTDDDLLVNKEHLVVCKEEIPDNISFPLSISGQESNAQTSLPADVSMILIYVKFNECSQSKSF